MNIEFIGFTLDVIGKVLVAYTAIMVHHRVWKEHTINKAVFVTMKKEQILGVIGIIFIILGFILQIPSKI